MVPELTALIAKTKVLIYSGEEGKRTGQEGG